MGHIEQGSHDDVATAWNARQPRRARPLDGVHEERLSAIACGVRREDAGGGARRTRLGAELAHVATGGGIAHVARSSFQVLTAQVGETRVLHAQGQSLAGAQLAHERLIAVGCLAAQMVIDVQDVQSLAGDARRAATVRDVEGTRAGHEQQRGRVRTA